MNTWGSRGDLYRRTPIHEARDVHLDIYTSIHEARETHLDKSQYMKLARCIFIFGKYMKLARGVLLAP